MVTAGDAGPNPVPADRSLEFELPASPSPPAGSVVMPDLRSVPEPPWERQRLLVPREDGTLFARPSIAEAVESSAANQAHLDASQANLQGRTLERLRKWTRETLLAAARDYTSKLRGEDVPEAPAGRLFVGGHQPTLFHPGVWVKNFALGAMAAQTGGLGLNLVIDNDTVSTTRIRVPQGTRDEPALETLPFDDDRPTGPWEDARLLDAKLFQSFGERVAGKMAPWEIDPLVREMWPAAVAYARTSDRLADALTAARHRQERTWGLENLELPISRLCTLDPFLWFTGHILAQLPRFREVHNQVLVEYRHVNRVRSRTHPVPELKETDGWHEAPFWVWNEGESQRGRLFARQTGREVALSNGVDEFARLKLSPDMDACCAVEGLRELTSRGIRLRTRALTTTLFARLCLADLFVHGIGGAKYDEMTDRIIARFYRIAPPAFQALSATLHLPIGPPHDVTADDERRLVHLLRDLDYNADRHGAVEADTELAPLATEKRSLIADEHAAESEPTTLSRRQRVRASYARFRRFQELNQQLATAALEQRRHVEEELAAVRRQLAANAILKSREFSFCLYPAEKLQAFYASLGSHDAAN